MMDIYFFQVFRTFWTLHYSLTSFALRTLRLTHT
jgi:hypothetical protein